MSISQISLKDKSGFTYKFPDRQCINCASYPCVEGMKETLFCNFAAYGCKKFEDIVNIKEWNPKK